MRLEAHEVTAGYDTRDVLAGVSAGVEAGEFVGLIGPNGCGKSTLLRVLSRVLRPRRGAVTLDGRDLWRWTPPEAALRIAFVPQQEATPFEFLVRDVVLMGRHPHIKARGGRETAEDYDTVNRALADADTLHLADRPVTTLSGGEVRRVLLARALAQAAPLLLLDEPTAHLDITHQIDLMALTRRLTMQGTGALAALHDLNQAAEFCDRLLIMRDGRVLADGPPADVLTPANLRRAYDADAQVGVNPATGRPFLLAVHPARERAQSGAARRIHVICGGGEGVGILGALARAGFTVTAGVLNRLDSDATAAEALGLETVLEAPFSPVGADARRACAELIAHADIVCVAPTPFGRGNLANLELVAEAQERGKPVLILGSRDWHTRDFTQGAAARLFAQFVAQGAQLYARLEDWPGLTQDANNTDLSLSTPDAPGDRPQGDIPQ